jgi:hypothetical protein
MLLALTKRFASLSARGGAARVFAVLPFGAASVFAVFSFCSVCVFAVLLLWAELAEPLPEVDVAWERVGSDDVWEDRIATEPELSLIVRPEEREQEFERAESVAACEAKDADAGCKVSPALPAAKRRITMRELAGVVAEGIDDSVVPAAVDAAGALRIRFCVLNELSSISTSSSFSAISSSLSSAFSANIN